MRGLELGLRGEDKLRIIAGPLEKLCGVQWWLCILGRESMVLYLRIELIVVD